MSDLHITKGLQHFTINEDVLNNAKIKFTLLGRRRIILISDSGKKVEFKPPELIKKINSQDLQKIVKDIGYEKSGKFSRSLSKQNPVIQFIWKMRHYEKTAKWEQEVAKSDMPVRTEGDQPAEHEKVTSRVLSANHLLEQNGSDQKSTNNVSETSSNIQVNEEKPKPATRGERGCHGRECFLEGMNTKDEKIAFSKFKESPDLGNFDALFETARHYELGLGTDKSIELAIEYYEEAHKIGYKGADLKLFNLYFENKNYTKAFDVLPGFHGSDNSSNLWNYQRHYWLGRRYEEGLGVEPDKSLAIEHYSRGSGIGDSFFRLGYIYEHGVEKDDEKSQKNYRLASELGHEKAGEKAPESFRTKEQLKETYLSRIPGSYLDIFGWSDLLKDDEAFLLQALDKMREGDNSINFFARVCFTSITK